MEAGTTREFRAEWHTKGCGAVMSLAFGETTYGGKCWEETHGRRIKRVEKPELQCYITKLRDWKETTQGCH